MNRDRKAQGAWVRLALVVTLLGCGGDETRGAGGQGGATGNGGEGGGGGTTGSGGEGGAGGNEGCLPRTEPNLSACSEIACDVFSYVEPGNISGPGLCTGSCLVDAHCVGGARCYLGEFGTSSCLLPCETGCDPALACIDGFCNVPWANPGG